MQVAAIVLAAGESRRMGRQKLTLPYGDSTILETVIRALQASSVASITVVLGRNWEHVYATVEHLEVQTVVNPRPERGMLSSAQWALAQAGEADAYLFALGDQPQLQAATVDALIHAAEQSPRRIFLPSYGGKRGHPLLVLASYKAEILDQPETVGLNALLAAHPDDVEEVPVGQPSVLEDIDTPEDYQRSLGAPI